MNLSSEPKGHLVPVSPTEVMAEVESKFAELGTHIARLEAQIKSIDETTRPVLADSSVSRTQTKVDVRSMDAHDLQDLVRSVVDELRQRKHHKYSPQIKYPTDYRTLRRELLPGFKESAKGLISMCDEAEVAYQRMEVWAHHDSLIGSREYQALRDSERGMGSGGSTSLSDLLQPETVYIMEDTAVLPGTAPSDRQDE